MDVTGAWKGDYTFEETPEDGGKMAGHIVHFTMTLKQGWFGLVSGTVQDDARTGFPEVGVIKGKFSKGILTFRKQMPVLRLIHESSRLTLEQWAERHKVVMDSHIVQPSLMHRGDLSADGLTVEGRWRMGGTSIEVPGSYQQLKIPTLEGAWKMKRES